MFDYNIMYRIINSCRGGSARRFPSGKRSVRDSCSTFRGVPVSDVYAVSQELDSSIKEDIVKQTGAVFKGAREIQSAVLDSALRVRNAVVSEKPVTAKVLDGIFNSMWGIGGPSDPASSGFVTPNIWLSPAEANALYSQKGLPETVINKKSKSTLLNGCKIRNPRLSARQIDAISENMMRLNLPSIIADSMRDSLVYGGGITFPLLKGDTPVTMSMDMEQLLKAGVLKKGCVSRFITLDRWNTWIVPPVSPCQKDYLEPDVYYIPYMGCDVSHARTARIVTSPQAGWWGKTLTQGWGISDFCGFYLSYVQYVTAKNALPNMIQQMSLLVRTTNIDAVLATQGANVMDDIMGENAVKVRHATQQNPINMDILGDLKAVNRNFSQVPELIRLLRQAFAADANIPEPMLLSSEKGNFASGDDTQGNLSKQWESVKYIYKDAETQLRRMAMIIVIDTLGLDREVLKALPYTTIQFDSPVIANATEKAEIAKDLSESFFNLVGGQMPMDKAAEIAFSYAGDDLSLSSDTLEQLKAIQAKKDKQDDAMKAAELKAAQEGGKPPSSGGSVNSSKAKYTALEQKQHTKVRVGAEHRSEGLQKLRGSAVK